MASQLHRVVLCVAALSSAFLSSRAAIAQAPAPAAPPCVPACRVGFVCHQGTCVSMCNPPCPPNLVCIDGARCDYAPAPMAPPPPNLYEPPPPPKKAFADRTHSLLAFHLGFGGDVEANSVATDLDSTLGLNLRVDIPVAQYLLLGPFFQLGAWRPDVSRATPNRSYYFDIDLAVRGRIPIEADPVAFQVWAGVPIGLTMSFLGEGTDDTLDGFGIGWNVGILFGGAVHFSKKFGMFAEIGWLQHKMNHDREVGTGDVDFRLAQGVFNVGFVFGN